MGGLTRNDRRDQRRRRIGAIAFLVLHVGALVADSFVHFGVTDVATFAIP